MSNLELGAWANELLLLGISTMRIALAFAMLPLFSTETIPATVRNSILIALGLVSLSLQPPIDFHDFKTFDWLAIFAKEALVGFIIGFFFGAVLWALEAAGQIVDAKVGATMAQVVDPLAGHQTSLNGAFLGRMANLVFIFSGGLALLVGVIIESYAVWPIAATFPRLAPAGLELFEAEFGRLMVLATLLSAPILAVLFVIDLGLGLVNRFAQQLNVFQLSLSIKSFVATAMILLMLTGFIQAVINDVLSRPAALRSLLSALR